MPVLASLLAAAIGACGPPGPPSPIESPPTAPTIVLGDWQATNGRWTFTAVVNPRGSPTDVVLEYGFGGEAAPVFDRSLTVETELLDAKAVTANLELPEDAEFCARFTATNEIGSTSTESRCPLPRPSGFLLVPVPTASSAASASPWTAGLVTTRATHERPRPHAAPRRPDADQPVDFPPGENRIEAFRPGSTRLSSRTGESPR